MPTINAAHRRVLDALADGRNRTPAELKRALPGEVPVSTIRSMLGRLAAAGLVEGASPHPGTSATTYRQTPEGAAQTSTGADDRGPVIARALGAGRYLASTGTIVLTLDEAADLATRLRMLARATRAEVLDVLTGHRDAERLADAIVARLAALDAEVGADA